MRVTSNIMIIRSLVLMALLSMAACAAPGSTTRQPVSPTTALAEQLQSNGISVSYPRTFAWHVKTCPVSRGEYMSKPLPDYIQVSFDDNAMGGIVATQAVLVGDK